MMSDEAKRKRIIRLPTPRQQALYETRKAIFNAMLLDCKDG
jgi:hypothetical protein